MAENKEELKRLLGLPGGASGNGHACQCRRGMRNRFDPWVGKIPWKRACDALQYSWASLVAQLVMVLEAMVLAYFNVDI